MCGLAGFVRQNSGNAEEMARLVDQMNARLLHRGPDDGGRWVDPASGVALGHRRLSILDLSPQGHQPKQSHCGRYWLAYNGEVYNYRELQKELEAEGERFAGHSDTEVILAAMARWGVERSLPRFNGMFAFALWDTQTRRLVLARDRMGKKPLYYGWMGQTFLFGSELKALEAHPDFRKEIDRNALALYMRHNYIPAPYSIYQGVNKLPQAHWMALDFSQGGQNSRPRPQPQCYWNALQVARQGVANPVETDPKTAVDELERRMMRAVGLRMISDVPLGAFLSGGIDSSLVVAMMQAQSGRPVKTFTIGFHEEAYNEAEHAKAVAAHLGTDHTELYLTPQDALDVVPLLPGLYDEPFADSSQIPTYLVSKLARSQVTVALSGDAGDELFAGYNRYFVGGRLEKSLGRFPRPLALAAAGAIKMVPEKGWDSLYGLAKPLLPGRLRFQHPGQKAYKLAALLQEAERTPQGFYRRLVSHWPHPAALVLGGQEAPTPLTNPEIWNGLPDYLRQVMFMDLVTYLPDDILVKVDRASMGVSLETRAPLLDVDVVEWAWRVPLALKVRQGKGKWLLRQLLYRHVPEAMIERPKMGFGVPIDHWLRGPLKGWAQELLSEKRLKEEGFFDPAPIQEKLKAHLSGEANWAYLLWDVLMFQAWKESHG